MGEGADYTPGAWAGHDFKSARKHYDAHAGRSYADAVGRGVSAASLVPEHIRTDSTCPLIVSVDVTGSMGAWPATIFSKLPYLDHEARTEYLGEDTEVCFCAVGDEHSDQYPLQVRPFSKGTDMKKELEKLIVEGGGGGQLAESYELCALYASRNIQTPNATARKPVYIFIGDEHPYDVVSRDSAKRISRVDLEERLTTKQVFQELMERFSVYMVLKPYNEESDEDSGNNQTIFNHWKRLVGEERIARLGDPNRVVDVIFGLLAQDTDRLEYFRKELEARQNPDQVKTVYTALKTVHAIESGGTTTGANPKLLGSGKSTLFNPTKHGKKGNNLL